MKQKIIPQKISAGWKGTVEMSSKHTQFYLDKQNAKWKGVCAGISDYTGVDVLWVRLGAVILTLAGGFPWTLVAYFGAPHGSPTKSRSTFMSTMTTRNSGKASGNPLPAQRATFVHASGKSTTALPMSNSIMSATTSSWPTKSKACAKRGYWEG
jgi:phage shock protein C